MERPSFQDIYLRLAVMMSERSTCERMKVGAVINCTADRDKPKVVFCSHLPCVSCGKAIINLGGVQRVIYRNDYRIKDSLDWFERASIKAVHLPGSPA